MPYIQTDVSGAEARRLAELHIQVGHRQPVSEQIARRTDRYVIECSSFLDPGEDWSKLRLYDAAGAVLAEIIIPGY